ncbi:MAG TPA: PDGLE domain-containing protein [Terriglobia bacterium]|jgi:hypothetical protein|nr:PDGLE domain-containing protein [Terriglobia bacterium]
MRTASIRKLWLGLALLILLSPVGVILPEELDANGAWGEWRGEELQGMQGYVPAKLAQLNGLWKALLPDYAIPGMNETWQVRLGYVGSAALGAGLILVVALGLGKWLSCAERQQDPEDIGRA